MDLQLKKLGQILAWVVILISLFGLIYLLSVNIYAYVRYRPETIVTDFVGLVENPTDKITDEEKKTLKEVTDPNWFEGWWNEGNLKTLREISQQNRIAKSGIQSIGESNRYAKVELGFTNDYKNPESKKAVLYLEKYGNWYTTGYRWRIYKIDMPKKDSIVDNAKEGLQSAQKGVEGATKTVGDKIKDTWNGLFGGNTSQNSSNNSNSSTT